MKKTLLINENNNEKLVIKIIMDQLTLGIEKKDKNLVKRIVFEKQYTINIETQIDQLINEFYNEYLEKLSNEKFWAEKFENATKIDILIDED